MMSSDSGEACGGWQHGAALKALLPPPIQAVQAEAKLESLEFGCFAWIPWL